MLSVGDLICTSIAGKLTTLATVVIILTSEIFFIFLFAFGLLFVNFGASEPCLKYYIVMKNLFAVTFLAVLAAASVALFSCNNSKSGKGKLDPNAKVYISAAPGVRSVADSDKPGHLSAREIVKQAQVMCMDSVKSRGVGDWQRDTANNRLLMASTDIISTEGELGNFFIKARDIIFVTINEYNSPKDTIAYISNKTMEVAEKKIRAAFDANDHDACYKLFEEAFTFVPINGEEWRALKAKNRN